MVLEFFSFSIEKVLKKYEKCFLKMREGPCEPDVIDLQICMRSVYSSPCSFKFFICRWTSTSTTSNRPVWRPTRCLLFRKGHAQLSNAPACE